MGPYYGDGTTAPDNKNESPLFESALGHLKKITKAIGVSIVGSIMSLDGVYDSRKRSKIAIGQTRAKRVCPTMQIQNDFGVICVTPTDPF